MSDPAGRGSPEFPPPLFLLHRFLDVLAPVGVRGQAGLLEVPAEALVAVVDVLDEPVTQKVQQLEADRHLFLVHFLLQGIDLLHQLLMLFLVDIETGVVRQPHQALFEQEVRACVFRQAVQDLARGRPAVMLTNGVVQLIEQVHQHFVLLVDFLDIDAELVGPLDQICRAHVQFPESAGVLIAPAYSGHGRVF